MRALFAILTLGAAASAAEPLLDRLEPQGVQRGVETRVSAYGARLGWSPQELMVATPGIEITKLQPLDDNGLAFTLRPADDCPLGPHGVRLRTATGVSNLLTLHVGAYPTLAEAEPNSDPNAAQRAPFPSTVHGLVTPEDVDVFAYEVAEGARVSVEVEGLRLGRVFFDSHLEVLDNTGALIASTDDQPASRSDPFLTVSAPAGGRVLVRVREAAYGGDGRATYLLHVGDFPRPTAVYPPVAQRGATGAVRWIGTDGPEQTVTPPAAGRATWEARAVDDRGEAPTGLPLLLADSAPVPEAEPNDRPAEANPAPCPGVAAGVIGADGDLDHFRVRMAKGQAYDLRVRARELRSPLDSVLRVLDAGGKRLAGNDDDAGRPDSYLRFTPSADGEYVLQVEDRLARGGEGRVYALEVALPAAVAEVRLDDRRWFEPTVLEVPRGGRLAVLFTVTRREFGDPLTLALAGLPPGVTARSGPALPGDFNRVPVVLSAAAEAPLAGTFVGVTATYADASKTPPLRSDFSQQSWLVRGRNEVAVWSHFADRVAAAVTERLPFSIAVVEPKAPLPKNGAASLRVVATRDAGFAQPIAVRLLYHSPGMSSNGSISIPGDATEAAIPVTTDWQARVGDWPMAVVAESDVGGRALASSELFTLTVGEPWFDVGVPVVTARQGESAVCDLTITPRTGFAGPATIELLNLPPGVTAQQVQVEQDATAVAVPVSIAADARAGRHHGVHALVRLTCEGEPVEYRQGWSDFQVDPAEPPPQPKPEQTAARGTEGQR